MALSDKELYEYVEKFLSFEGPDGTLDLEGLEAFSKETDETLSEEDKVRLLNLAAEVRNTNNAQGNNDEQTEDEVQYTEYTSQTTSQEGTQAEQPAA